MNQTSEEPVPCVDSEEKEGERVDVRQPSRDYEKMERKRREMDELKKKKHFH